MEKKKDEGKNKERRRNKVGDGFWDSLMGWVGWSRETGVKQSCLVLWPRLLCILFTVLVGKEDFWCTVTWQLATCNRYHLPLLSRGDKTTKTVKAVIVKCLHWQIALYRSNLEERWTQFLQHWVSLHLAFFFIYTSSFVKQVQWVFFVLFQIT